MQILPRDRVKIKVTRYDSTRGSVLPPEEKQQYHYHEPCHNVLICRQLAT